MQTDILPTRPRRPRDKGKVEGAVPVLEGRHQRRVAPGHRRAPTGQPQRTADGAIVLTRAGDLVAQRSLEFYDAVARRLAQESRA